jgi:hypothetical protein
VIRATAASPFKHSPDDTGPLCRLGEEFRFPQDIAVTGDERVTCPGCVAILAKNRMCPNCGGTRVAWGFSPRNLVGVADGRLALHDVGVEFYMHCEECSETLATVDAEHVADFLTRWTEPR